VRARTSIDLDKVVKKTMMKANNELISPINAQQRAISFVFLTCVGTLSFNVRNIY
jgi:hypothetical protein